MKVLVTGGFGLVGHSLQKIVKDTHYHEFVFVSSKNGDLRDINAVNNLFDLHKPDVVVHLASCVGGVYANMSKNYDYLVDNVRINTNIVDACDRFGVKRLVSCLSTCIFPDKNIIYPITSDQLHNGLPWHTCHLLETLQVVAPDIFLELEVTLRTAKRCTQL